jgi:hypothetical protein
MNPHSAPEAEKMLMRLTVALIRPASDPGARRVIP